MSSYVKAYVSCVWCMEGPAGGNDSLQINGQFKAVAHSETNERWKNKPSAPLWHMNFFQIFPFPAFHAVDLLELNPITFIHL